MVSCVDCNSVLSSVFHGVKKCAEKIVDVIQRVMRAFIRVLSCGYFGKSPSPQEVWMLHFQKPGTVEREARALSNKLRVRVTPFPANIVDLSSILSSTSIAVMIRAKDNGSLTTERVMNLLSLVDRIAIKKWMLVISANKIFDLIVPRYENLGKIHKFCVQ